MIYVKETSSAETYMSIFQWEKIQLGKGIGGKVEKKKVMSRQVKKSKKEAVM